MLEACAVQAMYCRRSGRPIEANWVGDRVQASKRAIWGSAAAVTAWLGLSIGLVVGTSVRQKRRLPAEPALAPMPRPANIAIQRAPSSSSAPPTAPSVSAANRNAAPEPAAIAAAGNNSVTLAAALNTMYENDGKATAESWHREEALKALFSRKELHGKGQLEDLACREKVCRGVVRIANRRADREVFGGTFLSPEYVSKIHSAVSVTSRKKQSDGSILATFFVHPQAVFDGFRRFEGDDSAPTE